jgi:DNA invertase Pin-like site-specific DNA recombinase
VTAEPREFAAYYRKSKGQMGIPRQRELTGRHVAKIGGVIAEEFTDKDATAYQHLGRDRPDRPDFDRLIEFVRAHPGMGIAARHCDRLARNDQDFAALRELCSAGGHVIETAWAGRFDLSTAHGRSQFRNAASAAIDEVDMLTERITDAKLAAAGKARWLGGPYPYGSVRAEPPDDDEAALPQMTVFEPEAEHVRWAMGQFMAGASFRWIAADLRRRSVKSPGGGGWTANGVRVVLLRPCIAGLMVHRGEITGRASWGKWLDDEEKTWGFIVAEGQWRAFRVLATAPERTSASAWERKYLGSGVYLCGACGHVLRRHQTNGTAMYRCPQGTREQRHVTRGAVPLDEYVTEMALLRLAERAGDADARVPEDDSVTRALAEVSRLRDLLNEQAVSHARGDIDGEQLAAGSAELRKRLAAAQESARAVSAYRPLAVFAGQAQGDGKLARETWDRLSIPQRQAVIRAVMTVTVLPFPRGPKGGRLGRPGFEPEFIRIEPAGSPGAPGPSGGI